jgi:Divergent InlB B-repeat domain
VLASAPVAAARPAAVTWCGSDEVASDRVPDLEVSSPEQVRFVYVIPSDGTDNFAAAAPGMATDAAWISDWWQAQDPSRTPRFDRYPFPNCPSGFGQLDIGFIRLTRATADIESSNQPSFTLDAALAGAFSPNQKTIVYYDGPIQVFDECGATDFLSEFAGGNQGIAYVFLHSCSLGPPGSGETAEVAAHELSHSFGAVPDGAPHECTDNPNHACDDAHDLMYPFITDGSSLDSVTLDVGRDDYYGDGGPRWDVRDSLWLVHFPQFPVTLATEGSGTLAATAGTSEAGRMELECDTGCANVPIDGGTRLGVVAVPQAGWTFQSWSGACTGTVPTCSVIVSADTAVTATFVKVTTKITVVVAGRGRVTSTPRGLSCPGTCHTSFTVGAVGLTAKASRGWRFAGWSGACHGITSCVASGVTTVRARFTRA